MSPSNVHEHSGTYISIKVDLVTATKNVLPALWLHSFKSFSYLLASACMKENQNISEIKTREIFKLTSLAIRSYSSISLSFS